MQYYSPPPLCCVIPISIKPLGAKRRWQMTLDKVQYFNFEQPVQTSPPFPPPNETQNISSRISIVPFPPPWLYCIDSNPAQNLVHKTSGKQLFVPVSFFVSFYIVYLSLSETFRETTESEVFLRAFLCFFCCTFSL